MSGISGSDAKYISPTNDYNRSGGEGTVNVNVLSNMSQMNNRTSERLFQVASEPVESSELLCSSYYRESGSPYNFTSDIGGPLFRPRQIQLRNVIMPMIPNINYSNNEIALQFVRTEYVNAGLSPINPLTVTYRIPIGYYTPDEIANHITSTSHAAVKNQLVGQPWNEDNYITKIVDATYTASYDYLSAVFYLNIKIYVVNHRIYDNSSGETTTGSTSDPPLFQFWLTNDCSFALRGKNVIDFPQSPRKASVPPQNPLGTTPYELSASDRWNPIPFNSVTSLASYFGPSFIYSRYVTISSDALSLYAFGDSRVDQTGAGGGSGKIIGTISTSEYYTSAKVFTGSQRIASVDAPVLAIKNSQLKLNNLIDFIINDEFGLSLDLAFPPDNTGGPTLAFIINY